MSRGKSRSEIVTFSLWFLPLDSTGERLKKYVPRHVQRSCGGGPNIQYGLLASLRRGWNFSPRNGVSSLVKRKGKEMTLKEFGLNMGHIQPEPDGSEERRGFDAVMDLIEGNNGTS